MNDRPNFPSYDRDVRGPLIPDAFPVDSDEERMNLDFRGAVNAESFTRVCDELPDEICCDGGEIRFRRDLEGLLPLDDLLACDWWFIGEERWVSNEHLEENHA